MEVTIDPQLFWDRLNKLRDTWMVRADSRPTLAPRSALSLGSPFSRGRGRRFVHCEETMHIFLRVARRRLSCSRGRNDCDLRASNPICPICPHSPLR